MENSARLETSYFPKPSEFLFARSASNGRCGELVVDGRSGFLDSSYSLIEQEQVEEGMELLVGGLWTRRLTSEREAWERFVGQECMRHPIRDLLHCDPFTYRAFAKPRGYAGDAVMLDYIYGFRRAPELPRPIRQIHTYTTVAGRAPCSVRNRLEIVSGEIDRLAAAQRDLRVLSVACGHLREASRSDAIRSGRVGEIVAYDQDSESLAVVAKEYAGLPVVPRAGRIRDLICDRAQLGRFDFAYALGLYDYLDEQTARRLTEVLFSHLRPAGTLLVANFAPGIPDLGYMESYMDWRLVYRDRLAMARLAAGIPAAEIRSITLFDDISHSIVFLEIEKA